MAATQGKTTRTTDSDRTATSKSDPHVDKIDRTAPAGSKNSLGEESVRDGRPATDDGTVEAIDEEGPGIAPPDQDTGS